MKKVKIFGGNTTNFPGNPKPSEENINNWLAEKGDINILSLTSSGNEEDSYPTIIFLYEEK